MRAIGSTLPRTSSNILFAITLTFAIALVIWWTTFQLRESGQIERMGQLLAAGRIDEAAQMLHAEDARHLVDVARRRRTMFLSEGVVFGLILIAGGMLFWMTERREARLRADHDRFLAGTTHELKTPLATIQLLLESLRDDRLPPEKRQRYLQSGLLEAQRLERGLTNVLTAAGLRVTRRVQRPMQPGNIADDVRQAVTAMQTRADAAGVRLQLPPLPPITTLRDAEAMQLVVRNLLDNAIKYSNPGTRVQIGLRTDGNDIVLDIEDQGRGMDADALRHAFTPFWRGKDTATGGSGLGLHLVRELVLAHGGTVVAKSEGADRGSEFTVRLPHRGAT